MARYIGAYHFSVEDLITPQFNHMVDTDRLRTGDLLTASQALYQLSYWPLPDCPLFFYGLFFQPPVMSGVPL